MPRLRNGGQDEALAIGFSVLIIGILISEFLAGLRPDEIF
ncbi:hypothetical protein WQQ_39500 [Hydrocarboniphaga effusa AP103]|uniref:Uncharacterized protein n=1 Tax=Hydrocarboniphaga effusa AP103 TaxID=1172194 RepID=I8T490_9GAMM|nr:hypothetical protein WQQ_39500 [Hydrocarboniphaga effusa AP103]